VSTLRCEYPRFAKVFRCDPGLAKVCGSAGQYRPLGFPAFCTPEWDVISGGHGNDANEGVANIYRKAGATVFHTAHDGAVRFILAPTAFMRPVGMTATGKHGQ
jgi:hypothetical protein